MSEFIKFAGRLLNDVTFLLDEMLTKLTEIKKIQQEQSRVEEWQAMTQERRQDRLSVLRSSEAQASSWSYYSSSMLVLLIEFTSTTRGAFISGEIVGRLAATLNYVLDMLAGPRSSELRTKDMEKYGFNPAQLLSSVLSVYLNLAEEPEFIQAVATEGRSYKKELFERAGEVALKKVLKTVDELQELRKFVNKVEELGQAMDEEEIDDFPDDFQGAVFYYLSPELVTDALPRSHYVYAYA
jgi:ubiquitin conjugation factor E4 B